MRKGSHSDDYETTGYSQTIAISWRPSSWLSSYYRFNEAGHRETQMSWSLSSLNAVDLSQAGSRRDSSLLAGEQGEQNGARGTPAFSGRRD
ncbi:hypothetical protein H8A99_04965 [Bradyrhizobium sp. Arg68]|uniref:hypothetical protein n=1 Tax=Bradyrhizobium ivorense TaxID=2511166 RepID=UPI001E2F36EC|nr:hypothetical protein [Bradyrhizobium ivorense]MCC8935864.1 hypothetical protein [Bradyrhizobium ivorense]